MKTLINADFTKRIVIRPNDYRWMQSPMPGVERVMLDRIGDEVARATSIVCYEPNSKFTPHIHSGGEEIFVLDGVFADEHQSYKKGAQTWHQGLVDGLTVMPLHAFENEHVALVKWAPNTRFNSHHHSGGEEIFVLAGTFYDEHGCYPTGSWLRSPHMSQHTPFTKEDGALIYVKTGHL